MKRSEVQVLLGPLDSVASRVDGQRRPYPESSSCSLGAKPPDPLPGASPPDPHHHRSESCSVMGSCASRSWEGFEVAKKIIALVVVAGAVLFFVKRSRSAKADADLWREATAPTD